MKSNKLVVILRNGRTVVLTTRDSEEELKEVFQGILNDIKDSHKYIIVDNVDEQILVSTEEIAAIMIGDRDKHKAASA